MITKEIVEYNAGRNPDLIKLKYMAMKESPFRFFRGTAHLFYKDIKGNKLLKAPLSYICGDAHLENFGSFKGDNRLAYFDMNDFDEAFLGPVIIDVIRLATSIFLAKESALFSTTQIKELVRHFLESYQSTLSKGLIRYVERETAEGLIKDLLQTVGKRKFKDLLKERTKGDKLKPHDKLLLIKDGEAKLQLISSLQKVFRDHKILDAGIRFIGTGSIGIERYLLFVEGKSSNKKYLLDMKETLKPSALKYLKIPQPAFDNPSERLIKIQTIVQSASPAYLKAVNFRNKYFVLKDLQPMEDRIDLLNINKYSDLEILVRDLGNILAWGSLRSSGRMGSATADELMQYSTHLPIKEILDYSYKYSQKTVEYFKLWKEYKPE
jgi:uncharacterized protein (DUF2252 family)